MNILFICTGNTCRSPMAEGYLKSKNIKDLEVLSAGIFADLSPISRHSNTVLLEKGIDMSHHISRQLTVPIIEAADKIICLADSHRQTLLSIGIDCDKISVLGDGIADPYGRDIEIYRKCRDDIFSAIDDMFSETQVRQSDMSADDAKNIAELEKQTFSEPWSKDAVLDSHKNGTIFLIAEKNDDFLGYCGLNTVLDEGYITNIAVKPEHRRQGVASAILTELDEYAKKLSLDFISLEVRESNLAAQSLYLKHGYEVAGQRKNFYIKPRENAIIMTKRFKNEDTQH